MSNEFTAIIERDGEWFIGYCPEIPGANGQGNGRGMQAESGGSRSLILEGRRDDALRGIPPDAKREIIRIS